MTTLRWRCQPDLAPGGRVVDWRRHEGSVGATIADLQGNAGRGPGHGQNLQKMLPRSWNNTLVSVRQAGDAA